MSDVGNTALPDCPYCGPQGKPRFHKGRGVKCHRCKCWGPDPMVPFCDWNTRAKLKPEQAAKALGDALFSRDWMDGQNASSATPIAHDAAASVAGGPVDRKFVLSVSQAFILSIANEATQ